MSIVIGLTGPTGAGKSIVKDIAEGLGITVIDCDKLAREAVKKGTEGLKCLVEAFSADILNSDGTLNRKELAKRAFCSKEKTELLNRTLLPHISRLVTKSIKDDAVLLDAPTLFESGLQNICNKTVSVLAEKENRLERIMLRDNITREEAELRISAGKPDEFYEQHSDYTVHNNGEIAKYNEEIKNILLKCMKG